MQPALGEGTGVHKSSPGGSSLLSLSCHVLRSVLRPDLICPLYFGNINGFKWGLDKVGKLEGVRIGRGQMRHACFSQQVFTERLLGAWLLASC